MFNNLNDKKLMNKEDLINKYNSNNSFFNNIQDNTSNNLANQKPNDLNNIIENNDNNIDNNSEGNISSENNFLNDSLENEDIISHNREEIINKEENLDELYTSIINNKRKSIIERNNSITRKMSIGSNNTNTHKISNLNSCQSTQTQTNKKKFLVINKGISPKYISEFKYDPLINTNGTDNIVQKINKNITFFKNWLSSINLPFYYENFINNDIYEIKQLIDISKEKTRQEIFSFINSIINTNKIGHIYRILIKIDIDTGFINNNFSNFLTPKRFPKSHPKNNSNYNDNELLISGIKNVFCTNKREERCFIKLFFEKYNLKNLCSNFMNNGFDIIEYVILQMFSRFPINDYILEKDMNISDVSDRKKILEILNNEVDKIYKFMKSEEYLAYTINRRAKYEDLFLSYDKNNNYFIFNDDDKCNYCHIF